MLQLDKEGKERIIAFTSKRLTPAPVKYGVTSKEACALAHCLRKFRTYIHGNPCVAITDHKAITAVMSGKEFETERLNRLHAELMEYDIHDNCVLQTRTLANPSRRYEQSSCGTGP